MIWKRSTFFAGADLRAQGRLVPASGVVALHAGLKHEEA